MKVGTIRRATEIGKGGRGRYIWHACVDCGKERWVAIRGKNGEPKHQRCHSCGFKAIHQYGEKSSHWKGGRTQLKSGYVLVSIPPNDFFYPMASLGGQVLEHRLLMAKYLNRCLLSWEVVHHKNGIRDDNSLENLELLSSQHKHFTGAGMMKRFHYLERKVTRLESENKLLKSKLEVKSETNFETTA